MGDSELLEECLLYLRALEQAPITPAIKIRATTLFTEATIRGTMEFVREDFLTALRVLKHL